MTNRRHFLYTTAGAAANNIVIISHCDMTYSDCGFLRASGFAECISLFPYRRPAQWIAYTMPSALPK